MFGRKLLSLWLPLLVICVAAHAAAQSSGFTLSAPNITLAANGTLVPVSAISNGSMNEKVLAACIPPPAQPNVKLPYCGQIPPYDGLLYLPVPAGGSAAGDFYVGPDVPPPEEASARLANHKQDVSPGQHIFIAGCMLWGICMRRSRTRRMQIVLSAVALAPFVGLTGCGVTAGPGVQPTYTAGIYTYTINAFDENNPNLTAVTTFKVTVPAGL